ncbi:MAG TPA: MBL fold metallo-hydrolase [Alphaproteobacteria bacterium]|nr:MBL fold metallo-hydrolase [Alphaproteobacteria bacterium]
MDLTLLGTGCPQVDTRRYGPANLVRAAGLTFLVDCGSGTTQRLLSAGSSGAAIDAVFLTHLHSDHIVDLYQLIVSSWHQGRDRPQRVFGPSGTRRYVDGLLALWKPELDLRIAHERRPSTAALEVQVVEYAHGEIWRDGGVAVRAVEVRHQPVRFAYGFVFEASGRRLAFSGDTAYSPELIAAARGADVLVHECFIHREMPLVAGVRTAETLAAVASYHTLSHEVGKVAREAAVGCLVLNHFVPVRFDQAALLAEVRRDFAGPIVVGEDLMRLDLVTGALSHAGGLVGLGAFAP